MADAAPSPPEKAESRVLALDGVRGFMTILVLLSHYVAEIPNGYPQLAFGWLAVSMFFVLSGFLIGRLIIEKMDRRNFLTVFVMRRVCRTVPSYMVSVLMIFGLLWLFRAEPWTHFKTEFPLWAYLTFTQNIFMGVTDSVGAYWVAPTWTLALEEQLYVLLPLVFFCLPRRYWLAALLTIATIAVVSRTIIFTTGSFNHTWGYVMLPTRGDVLVAGVIAAVIFKDQRIDLSKYDRLLRLAPVALLAATVLVGFVDPVERRLFNIFGPLFVSAGFACLLLAIVRGAPEGKRFEGRFFRFFGHISYCVYLTHLMVLGLVHGLWLGAKPALGSAEQWLATTIALGLSVLLAWLLTKFMEEPLTAYGRSWKWSEDTRAETRAELGERQVCPAKAG